MNSKFLKGAGCLATIFALAACSSEEMADGTQLPEGKYPITFTATGLEVTPVTRATVDGTWTKDDKVAVQVVGENEIKKYYAEYADSSTILKPTDADNTFYWKNKVTKYVSAWYLGTGYNDTLPTSWEVQKRQNIDNGYQKSDFLYAPEIGINFNGTNPLPLTFYHQTAKVVINIRNYGVANTDNMKSVIIKAVSEGTFNVTDDSSSRLSASGSTYDNITPLSINPIGGLVFDAENNNGEETALASYQALVIPQELSYNTPSIEINLAGYDTFKYIPTSSTGKWEGGKQYTYNITVKATKLYVTVNESIGWESGATGSGTVTIEEPVDLTAYTGEVYTVPQNASVVIDGKGTELGKRIIINDGAQVTLRNVKLTEQDTKANAQKPVIEVLGTATITISGKDNVIKSCMSDFCSAICVTGTKATLTINGTLEDTLILDASASANGIGIGATNNANLIINGGTTIIATGGWSAAAIGSNSNFICGDITINGGNITANAGQNAAAIGSGDNAGQCGNITMTGGTVTANGYNGELGGVGIGSGTPTQTARPTCGNIIISGGDVTATGGGGLYGGAGIGAGPNFGQCKDITITGGTVAATGKAGTSKDANGKYDSGAGIGPSGYGQCGTITISGADTYVTATAGGDGIDAYDIGRGFSSYYGYEWSLCGAVTISFEAHVTTTNKKIYWNL